MSCWGSPTVTEREGFLHGVASFDPTPYSVLIWTRYSQLNLELEAFVDWEVSETSDFNGVVLRGTCVTGSQRDFTVCVDVRGLRPWTQYYYRFSCCKRYSPTGMTKTLTDGHLDEMLFALVSCSNWAWGRFHVYDLLTRVDNLDLVVHCGDYIYEYKKGEYPERKFQARHGLRPKNECESLQDYRTRYACYRTDTALQELHRKLPMIAIWDDHEVADEAYKEGATNDNDASLPQFTKRKEAGIRAFLEWVPVRGLPPEQAAHFQKAHRSFKFGDLATLIMVENRLSCRHRHVEMPDTRFYSETARKDVRSWDKDAIRSAKGQLHTKLADPKRTMIGGEQVQKVAASVKQSVAEGQPWQVLVSGVVVSKLLAPRLQETVHLQPKLLRWVASKALKYAMSPSKAGQQAAELARMYVAMGKYGVPMNPDAWDGYQAEREQLYNALDIPGSNPVVLAGDSHNAWAHELRNTKEKRVGVEFDGPSITSLGAFEDIYHQFEARVGPFAKLWPLYLFTPWIEDALGVANPHTLRFCNLRERGAVLCHVTHSKFHAEFHFVDQVKEKSYNHRCAIAFNVEAGVKGEMQRGPRYLCIDGEIPRQHELGRKNAIIKGTHHVYKNQ